MKIRFLTAAAVVVAIVMTVGSAGVVAQDESGQGAGASYSLDFDGIYSRLAAAQDTAAAMDVIRDTCSECRTYDDYERLAADLKAMAANPAAKNRDVLYYGLGRVRVDQLICLSRSTDLEAGRLYMSVNDPYYTEAIAALDQASADTQSKSLLIDANLLRFLVYKEKFQAERSDAVFDEIVGQIASYSDEAAANLAELARVNAELDRMGLGTFGTKLKILYASKVDPATASSVLEGIKEQADERFANFDTKNAGQLYEQYVAAAPAYLAKEDMAARIMEIAEKFYGAEKYKEARQYYEIYLKDYSDGPMADYATYKIALCSQNDKDYAAAIERLEGFLRTYENSVWFDKAFEALARLYYEKLPRELAIERLQGLIDNHYRKNTGDFARVLIGLLQYRAQEYDTAVEELKKVPPTSIYAYAADTLLKDIEEIQTKKVAPSYGSDIADTYKVWDPYMAIGAVIVPMKPQTSGILGGEPERLETTKADDGSLMIRVAPGAKVQFTLDGLVDEDRFNEYMLDKEDLSRLPKNLRTETEKDLLSLHWAAEEGAFADENETVGASEVPSPGVYCRSISGSSINPGQYSIGRASFCAVTLTGSVAMRTNLSTPNTSAKVITSFFSSGSDTVFACAL